MKIKTTTACTAILLASLVTACEAPLELGGVTAEQAREIRRYDMFQAAARAGDRVAVVSSTGAAIVSDDAGSSWQRSELPGRPSMIDATACPNGQLLALDSQRQVWAFDGESGEWTPSQIDTPEATLSIHCAPDNRVWVSASFGTLYWRDASSSGWQEFSLYEDLQFTAVRFVDARTGFAAGEFGTVIKTEDGGASWERLPPIPNDFYPMAVDFRDADTGWVGGLDGIVWETRDGGQSWQRQESVTSTPVYNIAATAQGVFAVGGSAKLVELSGERWRRLADAPAVLAYLRAVSDLPDGGLLVAGGNGTLAVIGGDQL